MKKFILHCDLNNFFASAALLKSPTVKNMPVAVCGDTEKRHGIVLAKNYIAKGYGIKTAETVYEAKNKCPELVIIPPNFELYDKLSTMARKIYCQYSDKVECFGIDECWVDISNLCKNEKEAVLTADDIRRRIKRELGVTISVGISFNKYFAKLGSDIKKPDAVTLISESNFKSIIWKLSCGELLMAGKRTVEILNSAGIFTIGDLAIADDRFLKNKLGVNGINLKAAANGNDTSEVVDFRKKQSPKSIGRSATAERDLINNEEVFAALIEFSEEVAFKLKQHSLLAKGVCVTATTTDFRGREMRCMLNCPSNNSAIIAKAGYDLFLREYEFNNPLRAVGIRAVNLVNENECIRQMNFFDDYLERETLEKIENSMLLIRSRYGNSSVMRAACMKNFAKPSTPGFYK